MEAHRSIGAVLWDEVESGRLIEAEAAELRDALGRLALNMLASRRDGLVPARAAAYWLFYTRVRKLAVHALGAIGDPHALPALERVRRPGEPGDAAGIALHQAAARSMRSIRERRFAAE